MMWGQELGFRVLRLYSRVVGSGPLDWGPGLRSRI